MLLSAFPCYQLYVAWGGRGTHKVDPKKDIILCCIPENIAAGHSTKCATEAQTKRQTNRQTDRQTTKNKRALHVK